MQQQQTQHQDHQNQPPDPDRHTIPPADVQAAQLIADAIGRLILGPSLDQLTRLPGTAPGVRTNQTIREMLDQEQQAQEQQAQVCETCGRSSPQPQCAACQIAADDYARRHLTDEERDIQPPQVCRKCGAALATHDQEVCDDIGRP